MTVVRTGPKPGKQKVTYFKKGSLAHTVCFPPDIANWLASLALLDPVVVT